MILGQWDVLKADIGVMNSSRDEWHQLKHPGSVVCLVVDFPSVNLFSFTQYTNCSNLFFPLPCHLPWAKKTGISFSSVKMPWHLWWNSKVEIKVCILTFITSRHVIFWGQRTVYSWSFFTPFEGLFGTGGWLYFFIHDSYIYIFEREREWHRW